MTRDEVKDVARAISDFYDALASHDFDPITTLEITIAVAPELTEKILNGRYAD